MSTVIMNDYNNSEELIQKFPVIHPTPVETQMEKRIQNRLLTGFENWNRGYEAWEAWGDILYTEDSIYNVHSVKLSLKGYQMAMQATLRANNILMGDFYNMVISDDWAAIYYKIATENKETGKYNPGSVIEFVHFGDDNGALGCRVIEGWAGTRGKDFDMLTRIQDPNNKALQDQVLQAVVEAVIPDTEELVEKYLVMNPTSIKDEMGYQMRDAILQEFDAYNKGYEAWEKFIDANYDPHFTLDYQDTVIGLEEYKALVKADLEKADILRVSFDNMLLRGDWAAIHYRMCVTDKATGEKLPTDAMQFIHYENTDNGLKAMSGVIKR